MKVGILTFYYADNYGALLQALALQQYIIDTGNEVEFLDYVSDKEKRFYATDIRYIKTPKNILKQLYVNWKRKDSIIVFREFRNKYFKIQPYDIGIKTDDLLIVGSDQVWNERIVADLDPYLFADTNSLCKKISYAASIGSSSISGKAKEKFSKELMNFSGVTVREKSSEETLTEIGIRSSTVVDPVFLMSKDFWLKFAKKPREFESDNKYVLVYLLRSDQDIVTKANEYATKNQCKIFYIHPMGNKIANLLGHRIKGVGPAEFIWLINNADIVFTNSFHAVSFCCIFAKRFFQAQNKDLGNRVSSLLSLVNLEESDCGSKIVSFTEDFYDIKNNSISFLDKFVVKEP